MSVATTMSGATTMPSAEAGIVLCGGRSTRMGRDKNEVTWLGQTLLQQVVSAMEEVCSTLILVKSAPEQTLPTLVWQRPPHVLLDEVPHDGPAASARVGLDYLQRTFFSDMTISPNGEVAESKATSPIVVLTGNDSPLLQPALLRYLVARLRDQADCDAVVPGQSPSESFPLCAAYRLSSRTALVNHLEQGGRSLKGWLGRLRVDWVSDSELKMYDPDLRSLLNLNSPSDLQAAERVTDQH